ncbi:hypothetical protein LCM00_13630 [Bacillus infantis]|uniref:hypothetical protein n=1 Tax=Bacillus infantis TaxID=324767 RepID=UPI001CD2CDFA|nr:hypothetical protein [Bacillus infantis]MCA1040549.1 hypothetical protein [Bacillus infantis]
MTNDARYSISVIPVEQRIEQIEIQKQHSERKYPFHHFRGEPKDLPVVRVPVDLPIYRMENIRTKKVQKIYIKTNNRPESFFLAGQENVSAQQIQHQLLYTFAQKGKGDSIVPIKEVLEDEQQHEPILITYDGVVVNGNRRLSAMRELYLSGKDNYSHVDCMVLPGDATLPEISEIEFKLQMTRQTILPYDWIPEGWAIKEMLDSGVPKQKIADLMRKNTSELDNHIIAVDQAELYLTEWADSPGDYSKLDDQKEQIFKDIAKNLKNKNGEDFEASRYIGFILADNSRELGTRVYDYKGAFGTSSTEVIERLARRYELDLSQAPDDNLEQFELEFDLEEEIPVRSYRPVIDLLKDKTKSYELVENITDIFDGIKAERDDRNAGRLALKKVKEAYTKLMEADISRSDESTYDSIEQQLTSIKQRIERLEHDLGLARGSGE